MKQVNRKRQIAGLALLFFGTACQPRPEPIPEIRYSSPYVVSVSSLWTQDFVFNEILGMLMNSEGESVNTFLVNLGEPDAGKVQLIPYSKRAYEEAKLFKANLRYPHYEGTIVNRIKPTSIDNKIELQVEILRTGLKVQSCRADGGTILFGCAVEINRALSLVDPRELEVGRNLSVPVGQYEEYAVQNYLEGVRKPLLGAGE